MSFICGFSGNQEADLEDLCILPSTPQSKTARKSNKESKNPYSNRGLDIFEALLADLDGMRQKIYTKKGSEDISLVRFVYSNSSDVKPIVVKIKDHRNQDKDHHHKVHEGIKTPVLLSPKQHPEKLAKPSIDCEKSVSNFNELRRKFGGWWRPWYSLPFFVIVILFFLVFFGRSFAIFCTSIGWYMVPTTSKASKNEYSRKFSETIIKSPVNSRTMNTQPHRRSF